MGFSPTCTGVRRIRLNRLGTSCALAGLTSLVSSVATTRVDSDTLCEGSSSAILDKFTVVRVPAVSEVVGACLACHLY